MRDVRGVGIGFRPQLAASMFRSSSRFDFVEVVAETCRDVRARREAVAIAEVWPVAPHGVKLSLGSAEGIDEDRARFLGELARSLNAPFVSEHVSFVRSGEHEIGHLTELPMTRASVRVVARNVMTLRRHLPADMPILLENVARSFVWREDEHEMSEGDFYHEIVEQTGCALLLDVANLYANARNSSRKEKEEENEKKKSEPDLECAARLLKSYPLNRVRMIHVAGGRADEVDGFYFDTHAHPVPDDVVTLVAQTLLASPDAAVLLERDDALDDPEAVFKEVDRLREMVAIRASDAGAVEPETAALAAAQNALAKRLLGTDNDVAEVLRARTVLKKKERERQQHKHAPHVLAPHSSTTWLASMLHLLGLR